ncbi:MAG: limonene-1,2-epoxide hydrolase family protein [Steroidobacteraceae bacterium]
MNAFATVEEFLHAFFTFDMARLDALMADDFEFYNVPMPNVVIRGRDEMRALIANHGGFPEPIEPGSGGHEPRAHAVNGDLVLFERVDYWRIRGVSMRLPICSVWRVSNGKVHLWRDYFDISDLIRQMDRVGLRFDTSTWF